MDLISLGEFALADAYLFSFLCVNKIHDLQMIHFTFGVKKP